MLVDLHVVKCVFGISVFIYGARAYIMLFVIIVFIKFLKTNEQTIYIYIYINNPTEMLLNRYIRREML